MPTDRICQWLPLIPGLAVGPAHAAQNEGVFANVTAAILVLLGLLAIVIGVRNLRTLQHKHALPRKRRPRLARRFDEPGEVHPEIHR